VSMPRWARVLVKSTILVVTSSPENAQHTAVRAAPTGNALST
jgi:hypothetical protein